jgi:hypothetical protein
MLKVYHRHHQQKTPTTQGTSPSAWLLMVIFPYDQGCGIGQESENGASILLHSDDILNISIVHKEYAKEK